MYKEFYHFDLYPFENTPNPVFFFPSPTHREALASLLYGVMQGKGLMLVTGDVGTGKTQLLHTLKEKLEQKHPFLEIPDLWLRPGDILERIAGKIEIDEGVRHERTGLFDAVKTELVNLENAGRKFVLVIDESQLLPDEGLEAVRIITNLESTTSKLVQVILLGQEELLVRLKTNKLRPLSQRIVLHRSLDYLSKAETESYIRHRLATAGGSQDLFSPQALTLIYSTSGGSPRLINQLCDNCLMTGFGKGATTVDADIAREAIADMPSNRLKSGASFVAEQPLDPAAPAPPLPTPQIPDIPLPASDARAEEPAPQNRRPPGSSFRTTVLTLALVLATGIIALWLYRESEMPDRRSTDQSSQDQVDSSYRGTIDQARPTRMDRRGPARHEFDRSIDRPPTATTGYGYTGEGPMGTQDRDGVIHPPRDQGNQYARSQERDADALPHPPTSDAKPRYDDVPDDARSRSRVVDRLSDRPTPPAVSDAEQTLSRMPARPEPAARQYPVKTALTRPLPSIPFPFTSHSSTPSFITTIPRGGTVIRLARQHYQAWTPTVEDILRHANPEFASLDLVPAGSRFRLPYVAREQLVTQAESGALYIYYGTLISGTSARSNAEQLRLQGIDSLTETDTWNERRVYRLYLGPFATPGEAQDALTKTVFSYIPTNG